jgi:hypothetical protein
LPEDVRSAEWIGDGEDETALETAAINHSEILGFWVCAEIPGCI